MRKSKICIIVMAFFALGLLITVQSVLARSVSEPPYTTSPQADSTPSPQTDDSEALLKIETFSGAGGVECRGTVAADRSLALTTYSATKTVMVLVAETPVLLAQSGEFPYIRLLFAPQTDNTESFVRLMISQASPETANEFGASDYDLLETGFSEFLVTSDRPGDRTTTVVKKPDDGAGYRDEVDGCSQDCRCSLHWFDMGSELSLKGTVTILGAAIISDEIYPLTFKMTDQGWLLLYGRGTITPTEGVEIAVGQDDTVDMWLSFLAHDNQLDREAAASALGWLAVEDTDRDAAIEGLSSALADPSWEVRRNAAESLGRLQAESAGEALQTLLSDEEGDGWVSAVAKEALDYIQ